jgi:hypothetical protein
MAVQQFRKELKLHPWDTIIVNYETQNTIITELFSNTKEQIQNRLKCQIGELTAMTTAKTESKNIEIRDLYDNVVCSMNIYIYIR